MKIIFRLPRNLRKSIILALLFSVIFPWTLMAEVAQQAPKNSLSYFLENEETSKADSQSQNPQALQIIKTPEKISTEPQPMPGFEVAPPEPAPEEKIDRTAAVESIRTRLASGAAQSQPQENRKPSGKETVKPLKIDENKPEAALQKAVEPVAPVSGSEGAKTTTPATTETPETLITEQAASAVPEAKQIQTPATEPEMLAAATDEYVPFAGVLARMQQNKAKRTAEAQKLGVVLPSQGGDIATVSPSLGKMHQAIRDIINR